MNKPIKGITTCIVLASFIYSNCVYGLTSQSSRTDNNTLAWHGLFSQPENVSMIEKILSLESAVENQNTGQMIDNLRVLFAKILGDEPDGLGVMYNEKIKEAFIYSGIGIVHIYKNKHTEIPRIYAPDMKFSEAGINICIYRFKDAEKLEELQRILSEKEEIVPIEGLPNIVYSPERLLSLINSLPEGHLKTYLLKWMEKRGAPKIAPAKYAEVAEGLKNKDGSPAKGWLWIRDVPGLLEYNNCNDNRCLEIEIENAKRIRDHIEKIGVGVPIAKGRYLSWLGPKEIIVWNGKNGNDKYLNNIIAKNINGLFEKLSTEERKELIRGINEGGPAYGIAVGILDQSRHFVMNCRGDGFIGVSRWLLEKIESVLLEKLEKENAGKTEEAEKLGTQLDVLEAYLKTYLYHELRHEAFIEERKVLKDMVYEDIGLAKGMDIDGMDCITLRGFIDSLSDLKRKEFEEELERRQNGYDARYFVNVNRNLYELYLDNLTELEILKKDSLFWEAVSIVGYSKEKIDKDKGKAKESKHPNNLVQEDFERRYIKGKYAGNVYGKYENEYKGLYESKGLLFEQECRGKVSYMLYKLGLTENYRIPMWRGWDEEGIDNGLRGELKRRERELAKKSIIKLVEFISKNMIKSEPEPGETEISIFKPREESVPFQMVVSPLFLKARLLTDGAYNEGLLNSDMAFKISGIMETVAGDMGKFWELAVEACQERFERYGDSRFKNIDAKHMKRANIEREKIPRLKILSLFMGYLLSKYRKSRGDESEEVKDLEYLNSIYRKYMKGTNLFFNEEEVDEFETRFNRIYPAAIKALARQFGLNQKVDKKIFDYLKYEEDDMFIALWDAFDFAENLLPDLEKYKFSEPLICSEEELKAIKELRTIFDKNTPIKDADIEKKDTSEKIGLILTIYKDKILKYRKGLEYILSRYGTDIDISGKKAWDDLLVFTGGWAGAQWLAREYKTLISEGKLYKVLELDSGLSVFYRALLEAGVEERNLDGTYDNVSNKKAEYFGKNPKRITGNIRNDLSNFRDPKTGEKTELQNDYYELITSLYRIQGIDNIDGLYRLFSNAHSLLKYGGHFAITLPPNRKYSEESLKVLEKKFGFKAEIKGRTWNELSREFKDKIRQNLSPEAVKRIEKIAGKEFYVIVLEKVGRLKTAEITPEDKMLLAPIDETERMPEGRPRPPEEYEPGGGFVGISDSQARQAASFAVWQSAKTCGGTTFRQGFLARKLAEGMENSKTIKLQAEKEGEIEAHQDLIREMLEEQISEDNKLRDYIEDNWRKRIDTALEHKDKYETSVEKELENIFDYLDKLKSFIKENEEEFINMLNKIKSNEWRGLSGKLSADEVKKYNKVVLYERTNLNKDTFNEVLEVYKALKRMEKEENELEIYRQGHGEEYEKIRRLIEKYRKVSNLVTQGKDRKNLQKDIAEILNKSGRRFDYGTLNTAKIVSEKLIRVMLGDNTKYKNLLEFEEKMKLLLDTKKCSGAKIDWMESSFLFTCSDINFLNSAKEDWKRNEVTEQSVFAGKDRSGINRLLGCLGALEEWWVYKELIKWDKGLAGIVKDAESEKEYLDLIDDNLVYAPFKNSLGFNLGKFIHIYPYTVDSNVKTELSNISPGQNIGITIDEPMNYSDRFLSALEGMGFEIVSLYYIWLELGEGVEFTFGEGVRKEAEDFIRRGKRIIVVKMGDTFRDVDEKGFQLEKGSPASPEGEFLYNTRAGSRFGVLNDIDPGNLKFCVRELLSGKQIEEKYPEYAKELLAKEELQTEGMFDREGVESAVSAISERERKRQEDAQRRREEVERKKKEEAERQANLIKRSEKPLVEITYTGIWEGEEGKEAVKDLAHILLGIIPDFFAEELMNEESLGNFVDSNIITNEMIIKHPVLAELKNSNADELKSKIKQLIKYRQYDLRVFKAYREFCRLTGLSLSTGEPIVNCYLKIDGKERLYDLVNVWHDKDGNIELVSMYNYMLGIDIDTSPFRDIEEDVINDIEGQIIDLRRISSGDYEGQCPPILQAKTRIINMHVLSDPGSIISTCDNILKDVTINAGKSSLNFEKETLDIMERRCLDENDTTGLELARRAKNAFSKIKNLLGLIYDIYTKKNVEEEYLEYFEKYMRYMFNDLLYKRNNTGGTEKPQEIEIDYSLLEGFIKLFSGEMTCDEYKDFKTKIESTIEKEKIAPLDLNGINELSLERLETVKRPSSQEEISKIRRSSSGKGSSYYLLYDEGQGMKIHVGKDDIFTRSRKEKEEDIETKDFYELLFYLKKPKLFAFSKGEKMILDKLINKMVFAASREEVIDYKGKIVNYLKTRNTINRYLYFMLMFYRLSWGQKDTTYVEKDMESITEELSKYEPKVAAHNREEWGKYNLIVMLTEFYRYKQMQENEMLNEISTEIQHRTIYLNEAIRDMIERKELESAISLVGNVYHKELLTRTNIGIKPLRRLYQYSLEIVLTGLNKGEEGSKDIETIFSEIFFTMLYQKDEMKDALEYASRAIANVMPDPRKEELSEEEKEASANIEKFYELFREYLGEDNLKKLKGMVDSEYKKMPKQKRRELTVKEIEEIAGGKTLYPELGHSEYTKRLQLLREDQALRNYRLSVLNELVSIPKYKCLEEKKEFSEEVEKEIGFMDSPYELYYLIRNIAIVTAINSGNPKAEVTISRVILSCAVKKMVNFIKYGKRNEVINVLTGSFAQFKLMRGFVDIAVDMEREMLDFIMELFFSKDYMESSYAYEYLEFYLRPDKAGFERKMRREQNINHICNSLLEGIFKNFDAGKARRIFWLFYTATAGIPSLKMDAYWNKIAQMYANNKISEEDLQGFIRNAKWTMEMFLRSIAEKKDVDIEDIKKRIGLEDDSIFSKAIAEKEEEGKDVCTVIEELKLKGKYLYTMEEGEREKLNDYAESLLTVIGEKELFKLKLKIIDFIKPHGLTPVVPIVAPLRGEIPNAQMTPGLHPEFSRGGIKSENTINRYLYFKFRLFSLLYGQKDMMRIMGDCEEITHEIAKVETRLSAYTENRHKMSLTKLLKEFYRLKQMLKDESLKGAFADIQLECIDLIEMLRVKKAPGEELLHRMARVGYDDHKEFIPVVTIGLEHIKRSDQFEIERCITELEIGKNDITLKDLLNELHLVFLYYPDEKKPALRNIADAIVELKKRSVHVSLSGKSVDKTLISQNVKIFLEKFGKDNPQEKILLDEMIAEIEEKRKAEDGSEAGEKAAELIRLAVSGTVPGKDTSRINPDDLEKINKFAREEQAFRNARLEFLYMSSYNVEEKDIPKLHDPIYSIISNVENPYEIYKMIKSIETLNVKMGKSNASYVYVYTMFLLIDKMAEFIGEGMKNEIAHILTSSFNQYVYMLNFTLLGIEHNEDFRKFIVNLLFSDDYMSCGYAFKYIKAFIRRYDKGEDIERHAKEVDKLLEEILDRIVEIGEELEIGAIRRISELFYLAIKNIPKYSLKEKWDKLIASYKQGKVTKDIFEAIGNCAFWRMEDLCEEAEGDKSKVSDIKNRFGLYIGDENIFEKALREKEVEESYDGVKELGDNRIYVISEDERVKLRNLLNNLMEEENKDNLENCWKEIRKYIKEENTVNRCLYFAFSLFGKIAVSSNLKEILDGYWTLTHEIMKLKHEIFAYTESINKLNLGILIEEFYRLKQMLEDKSMEGVFLEIQIMANIINEAIREKLRDEEKLYRFGAIGNKYHEELIQNVYIGADKLQEINKHSVMITLILLGTEIEEKRAEDIVRDLHILSIYDKDEFGYTLKYIAGAIGELELMAEKGCIARGRNIDIRKNIDFFNKLFKKSLENYRVELEGLIKAAKREISNENIFNFDEFDRLIKNKKLLGQCGEEEKSKAVNLIKNNQTYRIARLSDLNYKALKEGDKYKKEELREEIRTIVNSMQSPYEIYYFFRTLGNIHGDTAVGGRNIKVYVDIMSAVGKRIMGFINEGAEEEVLDIFARSFNEFITMDGLVYIIMDTAEPKNRFRRFIINKFLYGNYKTSSYMLKYIKHFLIGGELNEKNMKTITEDIDSFFQIMLRELLSKGDKLDFIKFRRICELYSVALTNVPGFNLKEQLNVCIEYYSKGAISENTLRVIGRNILWIIEEKCGEIKEKEMDEGLADERMNSLRESNGLNIDGQDIFELAIKKKERDDKICKEIDEIREDNLFVIKEEEKGQLDKLIDGLISSKNGGDKEKIKSYIKEDNTINRYLYFSFILPIKAWQKENITDIMKNYEEIKKHLEGVNRNLLAYSERREEMELPVLIREFYRLQQIIEENTNKEISMSASITSIDIYRTIRNRLKKEGLGFRLAVSGKKRHKELADNLYAGADYLRRMFKYQFEGNIGGLGINASFKDFKGITGSLKVASVYFKDCFEIALESLAGAIAQIRHAIKETESYIVYGKYADIEDNIDTFLSVFKEYLGDYYEKLEELIDSEYKGTEDKEKRDMDWRELEYLAISKEILTQCSREERDKRQNLIRDNQAYRIMRLVILNRQICAKSVSEISRKEVMDEVTKLIGAIKNPYEMCCMLKIIEDLSKVDSGDSVGDENVIGVFKGILELAPKRFAGMLKEGMSEQMKDVLAGSYKSHILMDGFVELTLDELGDKEGFMDYMIDLYLSDNNRVSSIIYYYFLLYITRCGGFVEDIQKRRECIDILLSRLSEAVIHKDDQRLLIVLNLFKTAVEFAPDFKLEKQINLIIDMYRKGRIGKEKLRIIGRNLRWLMEEMCKKSPDKEKIIRSKFGLDINGEDVFEREIKIKDDTGHESFEALELIDGLMNKEGDIVKGAEVTYNVNGERIFVLDNVTDIRNYLYENSMIFKRKQDKLDLYFDWRLINELKKFEILGNNLLEYFNEAMEEIPKELRGWIGYEDRLAVGLADTSETLFIDCKRNGFIGINKIFLDILEKDRSPGKIVSRILLTLGFYHELCHEAGIRDEKWVFWEGIDLCVKLIEKYTNSGFNAFNIFREFGRLLGGVLVDKSEFLKVLCISMDRLGEDKDSSVDYDAEMLVEIVKLYKDVRYEDVLKKRLERLLRRLKDGKSVELTDLQMYRLLWLLDTFGNTEIAEEMAGLINAVLALNYKSDPGSVILSIEKEIFAWLYTEKELRREKDLKTKLRDMKYDVQCRLKLDNTQYNEQLKRRFEEYAETIRIKRDLDEEPLTEDEVDMALFRLGLVKSTGELARLRDIIREESGVPDNFSIIFSVPEGGLKLFWAKEPQTNHWTYTGAVFDKKGNRMHIPLPLLLKEEILILDMEEPKIPEEKTCEIAGSKAVIAVVRYVMAHIDKTGKDRGDIKTEENIGKGIKIMREIAEREMDKVEEDFESIETADYKKKVEIVSRSPIAFDRFINMAISCKKPVSITKVLKEAIIKNNDLLIVFLENVSRLRDLKAKNYLSENINVIVDDIRIRMGQFNMLMDLFIKEQDSQTQINFARGILCILGKNKDIIQGSDQINMIIRKIGDIDEKVNNRYDLLSALISVAIKLLSGNSGYKPGVSEVSMLLESFKRNMEENIGSEAIRSDFIAILATLENFCYLISQCLDKNPGLKEKFGIPNHKGKEVSKQIYMHAGEILTAA